MSGAITLSPELLADIVGAGQIGDLLVEVKEFGIDAIYEIGTIVSLNPDGRVVPCTTASQATVYGVIASERVILDADTDRLPAAHVIRRGSLIADRLKLVDSTLGLERIAPRLRELGIYLEGLEKTLAPPFRIRNIVPNRAQVGMEDVVMRVYLDGSVETGAVVLFGETECATSVLGYNSLECTIATVGAQVRIVKVKVRQTPWLSNEVNFAVDLSLGVPAEKKGERKEVKGK